LFAVVIIIVGRFPSPSLTYVIMLRARKRVTEVLKKQLPP